MERRARMNTTTSKLAFVNTTSRLPGSKVSGWKRSRWSWRLRRLIRCESGQIDRALAEHSYELQQAKAEELAEPGSASSTNQEMEAITDHLFLPEKEELDKLLRYEAMIGGGNSTMRSPSWRGCR